MLGWVRVNRGKKRSTFYVVIPWDRLDGSGKKKNWQFKFDRNGDRFESEAHAHRHLEYLRALIDDKAFSPLDWIEEKPHSFENLQETYFKACLSDVQRDEMSPSTIKTKRRYWRRYFLPFFSDMDVKHIRNIHLRQFHDQLPATLKAKTRLNIVSDVEGVLRWCKEEEILKGAVPHFTGMKDLRKKAQKERPKPRRSTHIPHRTPGGCYQVRSLSPGSSFCVLEREDGQAVHSPGDRLPMEDSPKESGAPSFSAQERHKRTRCLRTPGAGVFLR